MELDDFKHVMVATPSYSGDVCMDFTWSLLQSQMLCLGHKILLDLEWVQNLSIVEAARNYLLYVFLKKTKYTHIMFIDGDLGWQPDAIHRMVERQKYVIGGVYPRKNDKAEYPYVPLQDHTDVALRLPTGFMLCARTAIEAVCEDAPRFKMPYDGEIHEVPRIFEFKIDGERNLVSEDYVFSDKLRDEGFRLFVEPNINFVHSGRNGWRGNLDKQTIPAVWEAIRRPNV